MLNVKNNVSYSTSRRVAGAKQHGLLVNRPRIQIHQQQRILSQKTAALPASELADAIQQSYDVAYQSLYDLASSAAAVAGDAVTASSNSSTTAAAAAAADAAAAPTAASGGSDTSWFGPLTNSLEAVLKQIQGVLVKFGVPYSYGYSIILLTVLVKIVTFPLTKKQVESAMAVQSLKPRIDMIKARYGDDDKRVQEETKALYDKAEVNPTAGCLPSLATIPVFIGLYRSLTQVAEEGLLDAEGFYWIPDLSAPTSIATRGTEWLFPLVDGAPPIGWDAAARYLVLPALLVVAQWASSSVISPPIDPKSEGANTQRAIAAALPLLVGYFSLCVPSGLSLYYFANTVITGAMQVYLRKLGGATVRVRDLGPVTKVGSARRLGPAASDEGLWLYEAPSAEAEAAAAAADAAAAAAAAGGAEAGAPQYVRRKRRGGSGSGAAAGQEPGGSPVAAG